MIPSSRPTLKAAGLALGGLVLVGFFVALFGPPAQAQAQPQAQAQAQAENPAHSALSGLFTAEEVELRKFLSAISKDTGATLVITQEIDNQIRAKKLALTNVKRYEVPQEEIFEAYKAILKAHDLVLIPIGPASAPLYLVQNLRSGSARAALVPVAEFVHADRLDEYRHKTELIRTVIALRYMDISRARSEMANLVNQQYGSINAVQSVNALIITEFGPVVWAISKMLAQMDQEQSERELLFQKVTLEHLVAEDIEPILVELLNAGSESPFGGGGGGARRTAAAAGGEPAALSKPDPKIITEPRSNSLIIYAVKEDMEKITDLIVKLDQEVEREQSKIHIYRLKHALASDIEEVVSDLLSGASGQSRGRRAAGRGQVQGGQAQVLAGPGGIDDQDIQIVADGHTNSLLIHASRTQFESVKRIIESLDVRLPQVLIQAAIVELTEDFNSVFGVELGGIENGGPDSSRVFGVTSLGGRQFSINNGVIQVDPDSIASLGGGVGGIFTGNDFAVPILVQASARQGNNNLLSLPSILTNDNQYAEISVGQEIPFSTSTLSGSGNSQQSLGGYAEALITLGISPHISEDDYLRLSVELTVDSFNGAPPQVGLPPPRSTRALTAVITVPNRSTVVIGGLRQTQDAKTVTKIPVLGDIPLLGALFRSRTTTKQETTLYLFITPQILSEAGFGDLLDVTHVKETEVEQLIGERIVLIDADYGKERSVPVPVNSPGEAQIDSLMDQLPEMPYYRSPSDEIEPTPPAQNETESPATEESSAAPAEQPARGPVTDRSK